MRRLGAVVRSRHCSCQALERLMVGMRAVDKQLVERLMVGMVKTHVLLCVILMVAHG